VTRPRPWLPCRFSEWARRHGAPPPMRMTASWSGSFTIHRIQGCGAIRRAQTRAPLRSSNCREPPITTPTQNLTPKAPYKDEDRCIISTPYPHAEEPPKAASRSMADGSISPRSGTNGTTRSTRSRRCCLGIGLPRKPSRPSKSPNTHLSPKRAPGMWRWRDAYAPHRPLFLQQGVRAWKRGVLARVSAKRRPPRLDRAEPTSGPKRELSV
jgi:hypothetical protein